MSKGITQKMADKMVEYRIIGKNSTYGTFTHGPDIKSYAKAVKELTEYRKTAPTNTYTLVKVDCTVLPV
jgi:predicted secreted acid phosphatase